MTKLNAAFSDSSERVSVGRALDLPVYFGDAGSKEVLFPVHSVSLIKSPLTC
jgi:hypothetical protein